ncbi:MAG: 1-pyrroline-5-carboxylate dehydrogenase, partial [Chryseobacterium sp.]
MALNVTNSTGKKVNYNLSSTYAKAHEKWMTWDSTQIQSDSVVIDYSSAENLPVGTYRAKINAATMVGQAKTVHQAEIDAACEFIDFLRYNV